jgi:small subunit ribosomal protein S13
LRILEKSQVSQDKKFKIEMTIGAIREAVSVFKIEGELRSSLNIKRLMDIGCYRYPS